MKRTLFVLAAAPFLTLTLAHVPAWSNINPAASYGSPSAGTLPDRTIRIDPSTKYANVTVYETVRFLVQGADGRESSFDWRFDTFGTPIVPLAAIAPPEFPRTGAVSIYVGRSASRD